jgi:hypothetical protein
MEIISFTDNEQLLSDFIEVGYLLYGGNGPFIPPQRQVLEATLSAESSPFVKSGSEFVHFLAREGGMITGRLSAFVNPTLRDHDGTPVGAIGYFESIGDYNVARALLDNAVCWLSSRHGLKRIWGPMNCDIWHGYRFKTAGFQEKPFLGEPYNKPYYQEFFLRYGFTVKAEWDSLEVCGHEAISNMIARGEARYRMLTDRGYRFEHISAHRGSDDLVKLHKVLCSSFSGFLGFTEISLEEFTALFERSRAAFDPDLAVLVYDEQNRPAGFAVACIELADAVLAMKGKTGAWAGLKFAHHRKRSQTANFYIGGVTPEEMARRSGLGRAGFYYVIRKALDKGYDTILLTLRLKGNLAHGLAARSGCLPQSEYALYEWNHE